ncbi:MAG: RDD family protein [Phycisphaera sp.]|nr:RDD family protein [Phycisphaera sp.]
MIRLRFFWVACVVLLSIAASVAAGEKDPVLAASSGRHVFVIRAASEGQGWEIAHLDADVGPDSIRSIHAMQSRPEAIAAHGNRCWVVLGPRNADRISRVVISLSVERHPINGVWYADPVGSPQVLPPVPTEATVGGLVATESELMLVFQPSQRGRRGVERPNRPSSDEVASGDAVTGDEAPEAVAVIDPDQGGILRIDLPPIFAWERVPSPKGFERAEELEVGSIDVSSRVVPAISWQAPDGPRSLAWRSDEGDEWLTRRIEGLESAPIFVGARPGRTILAHRDDARGVVLSDLLSPTPEVLGLRTFASVPDGSPTPDVGVVLTAGGPWVMGVSGTKVLTVAIDRSTGLASAVVTAEEVTAAGTLVPYEIALSVIVVCFLAALLLRPAFAEAPAIATPGLVGLGFARRAAGLCIDLAPGAMASVMIFQLDPQVFIEDLRAGDVAAMPPLLALLGISGGISVVMEVLTGRSIGKWLVGGRTLRLDGEPAGRLQRGLRSLVRLAVLLLLPLAWPLALLALLDPLGRGIPELMTRTMVSSARPSTSD